MTSRSAKRTSLICICPNRAVAVLCRALCRAEREPGHLCTARAVPQGRLLFPFWRLRGLRPSLFFFLPACWQGLPVCCRNER